MQKCEIDWPICSHEPAWSGVSKYHHHLSERENGVWNYGPLTSIRNVEEERHRHHCEPKKKGGGESWLVTRSRENDDRTIGKAEGDQEKRERRHPQTRVEHSNGG